jgi:plasmid stability protein
MSSGSLTLALSCVAVDVQDHSIPGIFAEAMPAEQAQPEPRQLEPLVRRLDVMTLWRHNTSMSDVRRATVYFDPEVHRALKLKAAASDRSVSDMVNDAVRAALAEDAEDLEAFELREAEPETAFEDLVKLLRRRGKL